MPRTQAAGELFKKVTSVRLIRELTGTHGDTTTTAAVTGDGTELTVAVTAIANFTSGDEVLIIGTGGVEATKIGLPALAMPVSPPPKIAQASGAEFVEAELIDLGKIAKGSIQMAANRALTAILEEIGDTPVQYIYGDAEFGAQIALLAFNGLNLQTLMGYLEAETGTGAGESTAYQAALGVSGQALATPQVLRIQGTRFDAKTLELDFCNAFLEASVSATLARESPAQMQARVRSSALIIRQWT